MLIFILRISFYLYVYFLQLAQINKLNILFS